MKRLQVTLILLKNCTMAFFAAMRSVTIKQDCYWTINGTFFSGVAFGVPSDFQDQLIKTKQTFYCPNGHGQSYSKSKAEILQEKFDIEKNEAERRLREMTDRMLDETNKRMKAEKQLKRVHNGVCPCCNRSFKNLQQHMKTKHPEIAGKEVKSLLHTKITKQLK